MESKRRFVVFAGTKEGRELAEFMKQHRIAVLVCVATEYGETLLEEMEEWIEIRAGRMNQTQMEQLFQAEEPLAVVDATHPYAAEVTKNISAACAATHTEYLRLLRQESDPEDLKDCDVRSFPDAQSAADWLNEREGNILLTTGMKEFPVFAQRISDRSRLYARVLLQEEVFAQIETYGLAKKQIICMQGPFSEEMNLATLHMVGASYLVTKESGAAGGFLQKAKAAKAAGAQLVVIARPSKEEGYSPAEIQSRILEIWKQAAVESDLAVREVSLVGIGMGASDNMTLEAVKAFEEADCIIGAFRMLEALERFHKPSEKLYKSDEILSYIEQHPEYHSFAIGLSGDVGFYSGAKKLLGSIQDKWGDEEVRVRIVCGISSVVYLASRLAIPWEDMTLVSMHGREQNLISAVRQNEKVFLLASDANSIRGAAQKLADFGLGEVQMTVGVDLSYPQEKICRGTASDFLKFDQTGICAAVLMNERASREPAGFGIPDQDFVRGNVPMTKEEVRTISISKLCLTRNSVVYDVGAGTGSVAAECARLADRGRVYAIEWKEEACDLIEKNRRKFGASNLEIVSGRAPEAMTDLPVPTHAFIGGSGGCMRAILRELLRKNPDIRIVINCIALETLQEVMTAAGDLNFHISDITAVSVAKAKTVGNYHMMMGQNPIYVILISPR